MVFVIVNTTIIVNILLSLLLQLCYVYYVFIDIVLKISLR